MNKAIKSVLLSLFLSFMTIFVNGTEAFAFQCESYLGYKYQLVQNIKDVVNDEFIPPRSWAAAFAELALNTHLISQTDPILNEMGLIVEGGGLCGPTCVANIAASIDYYKNNKSLYWVYNSHIFIDGIIRNYAVVAKSLREPIELDPRFGTYITPFLSEYNPKNVDLRLNVRKIKPNSTKIFSNQFRMLNSILLGFVAFNPVIKNNNTLGHAIVILGVNEKSKQIMIVDPNTPSDVLATSYEIINNEIYFYLDSALYGDKGQNLVVLEEVTSFTIRK